MKVVKTDNLARCYFCTQMTTYMIQVIKIPCCKKCYERKTKKK